MDLRGIDLCHSACIPSPGRLKKLMGILGMCVCTSVTMILQHSFNDILDLQCNIQVLSFFSALVNGYNIAIFIHYRSSRRSTLCGCCVVEITTPDPAYPSLAQALFGATPDTALQ